MVYRIGGPNTNLGEGLRWFKAPEKKEKVEQEGVGIRIGIISMQMHWRKSSKLLSVDRHSTYPAQGHKYIGLSGWAVRDCFFAVD
jgi:hypothetical protein